MSRNYMFRKCTVSNEFIKLTENVGQLKYMNDLKVFTKKRKSKKEQNLKPWYNNKNIQPTYRNDEKSERRSNRRNWTSKSGKHKNAWREGKLQVQLYWHFKPQTGETTSQKSQDWLKKGKITRGTEYILIAAQNHAIKTSKAKIHTTRMNCNWRWSVDKDVTVILIISEYSKEAHLESNTMHKKVRKIIHLKLGKTLNFNHTTLRMRCIKFCEILRCE